MQVVPRLAWSHRLMRLSSFANRTAKMHAIAALTPPILRMSPNDEKNMSKLIRVCPKSANAPENHRNRVGTPRASLPLSAW